MIDLAGWPAIVLTAGLGTRLWPLSTVRAKAAVPVGGTPLVGRILTWLRRAGVRDVVLNLHHLPETIGRVVGDGAEWHVNVRYSWERVVLGSAGGPRRAMSLIEADRFLIVNGDTLTDCDLQAMARQHVDSSAAVTMAVVPGDVQRYGGVVVGAGHDVVGFTRAADTDAATSPLTVRHFIGVQAVDAAAFAGVSMDEPSETVRTLYPRLIAERAGSVAAFESNAEFLDIGTPRDYLTTVAIVAAREGRPLDRGDDCVVEPGATLSDTVLWDRVQIGRDAHLINCVVADDVTVPGSARYEHSALVQTADGLTVHPL
jgi:mannose-1-phosphate guanylyltransferase